MPGIEPGLHAPHACVLPVYYTPKILVPGPCARQPRTEIWTLFKIKLSKFLVSGYCQYIYPVVNFELLYLLISKFYYRDCSPFLARIKQGHLPFNIIQQKSKESQLLGLFRCFLPLPRHSLHTASANQASFTVWQLAHLEVRVFS